MDTSTAERAIPTTVFDLSPELRNKYLRKWMGDSNIKDFDVREILDWNYYIQRFSKCIQKIITIPAVIQHVK